MSIFSKKAPKSKFLKNHIILFRKNVNSKFHIDYIPIEAITYYWYLSCKFIQNANSKY